jgi:hypothetical protein
MHHLDNGVESGHPSRMRNQIVRVPTPDGDLSVIVTGDALASLREGHVLQDGASLVQHYRSVIAEVAREKYAESGHTKTRIILTGSDFVD